jgi:hypothetical protein
MSSGNQLNIPVIQLPDPSIVQIQQNINKVFNNIVNKITALQTTVNALQGIGDIGLSALTLAQYQAVHGKGFIQANGQSSVGTAYQALTMQLTVPTITVAGANAYIKVN